jgi:hypothetical protein
MLLHAGLMFQRAPSDLEGALLAESAWAAVE